MADTAYAAPDPALDPAIVDLLLRWRDDPVAFVREAIGVEPEKWQIKALRAIAEHDRVAIKSGHGVGKTAFESWVVLWWLTTRYPCRIPCTAPSSAQLEDVLWAEVSKWYGKLPAPLKALFDINKDHVFLREDPRGSFAVARTARKEQPEAFQGFHEDNMLFLVDEASGVDDIIFETGQGSMSTPGAKTLMCANPTRTSGYFFNAFTRAREFWHTMTVSCLDSSRVSSEYPRFIAGSFGETSNVYRVRVLGEFPTADDDAVIPFHLVEEAIRRHGLVEPSGAYSPVWGLDVARFGDDRTALCKRWGNVVDASIRTWHGKDTMQTTGLVTREFYDTPPSMRPERILVDVIGLGAGVVDRLREQNLPVIGVNVAERPAQEGRFLRQRDEIWWLAREWLEKRDSVLPDDDTLVAELTQIKYDMTSAGKIRVETKDSLKRRGLRSPDVAEAFILTFALPDLYAHRKKSYEPEPYFDS